MSDFVEGKGWVRRWYERVWGHGLQRDWFGRVFRTEGKRYQWTPVRLRLRRDWRTLLRVGSLFNWHGVEWGYEAFPRPVRNGERVVRDNPHWPGHHIIEWRRKIISQVFHIGPLLIICGEYASKCETRLTDDDVRAIEQRGKVVA